MKFDKYDKILFISLAFWIAILSINIISKNPDTDESTHLLVGLFIRDAVRDWISNPTFSFNKIYKYSISYLVFYPKISIQYPPLTQIFFAIAYFIFSPSIIVGRFVVLLFSICFIFLIYRFTYEIFKTKEVSLIASLIFLVSLVFVVFSTLAMLNVLSLLLFTLTVFLFFRAFQKKDSLKNYMVPAIAMSLCLLTRWEAVLIMPTLFLYTLLSKRQKIKLVLFSFVISFLLLSIYAIILYKTELLYLPLQANITGFGLLNFTNWLRPFHYLWLFVFLQFAPAFAFVQFKFDLSLGCLAIFGFLLLVSFAYYLIKRKKEWTLFLIWFSVVYIVMTFINNRGWQYTMNMLPAIIIPSSYIIYELIKKYKIIGLVFVILFLLQFVSTIFVLYHPVREYPNNHYFWLPKELDIGSKYFVSDLEPLKGEVFPEVEDISNEILKYDGNVLLNIYSDGSAPFIWEVAKSGDSGRQMFRPCLVIDYNNSFEQLFKDYRIEIVVSEKNLTRYYPYRNLTVRQTELASYLISSKNFEVVNQYGNYVIFRRVSFTYEKSDKICNYICSSRELVCSESKKPVEFLK